MIDDAYEDVMRERRRAAAKRIAAMEIDVPLDPDEVVAGVGGGSCAGRSLLTRMFPSMRREDHIGIKSLAIEL